MITYPSSAKTDFDRLQAVYALKEQMRLEHNRVGAIASDNWKDRAAKWDTYSRFFKARLIPLLAEQNRLRGAIRQANFTAQQWESLSDTDRSLAWQQMYGNVPVLKAQPTLAATPELDRLKAVDFLSLRGELADPTEDWTVGYVETDPAFKLTVAANQIDFTNIGKEDSCTVYKDQGVGFFAGTFTHWISFKATAWDASGGAYVGILGYANGVAPTIDEDPFLSCHATFDGAFPAGERNRIFIMIDDGALDQIDSYFVAIGTQYWLTTNKNGVDTDVMIYTDAARTALLDTLTVANGVTSFRYNHSATSRNWGGGAAGHMTGSLYNLDLAPTGAAARPFNAGRTACMMSR